LRTSFWESFSSNFEKYGFAENLGSWRENSISLQEHAGGTNPFGDFIYKPNMNSNRGYQLMRFSRETVL
jgi:hypothetical protein